MKTLKTLIPCILLSITIFANQEGAKPKTALASILVGGEGGLNPELNVGLQAHEHGMILLGMTLPVAGWVSPNKFAANMKGSIAYRYAVSGVGAHSWYVQPGFTMGRMDVWNQVLGWRGLIYGPRFQTGFQWIWENGLALALDLGIAINFVEDQDFTVSLGTMFAEFSGFVPMAGFSLGYAW